MTELERLALLGDKQAQKECTEKGIVLPCPKCLSKINVKETHDGVMWLECNCGLSYIFKSWEEQKNWLTIWNTRLAPPVGRCVDCNWWKKLGCAFDIRCKEMSRKKTTIAATLNRGKRNETDYCPNCGARMDEEEQQ